jgi:Fe-Mn family superoxide dismutase
MSTIYQTLDMAFILPDLGFDYNALEPHFDAQTVEMHYEQYHAGMLERFNESIRNTTLEDQTPASIFSRISNYSDDVRFYGGAFYNHSLFWKILSPYQVSIGKGQFANMIQKVFGSTEKMIAQFSEAAQRLPGSGWAWLIKAADGGLDITTTANHDNPLMDIAPLQGVPILTLDLWEHAYLLKFQHNKHLYIDAFWKLVNWKKVEELFMSS